MFKCKLISKRDRLAHKIYNSGWKTAFYTFSLINGTIGTTLRAFAYLLASKYFHFDKNKSFKFETNITNVDEQKILDDAFSIATKVNSKEIDINTEIGKKELFQQIVHLGRIWSGMTTAGIWIIEGKSLNVVSFDHDTSVFHPDHMKMQQSAGKILGIININLENITEEDIANDTILQLLYGKIPYYFVDDQENVPINLPMSRTAKLMTAAGDPKSSGGVPIYGKNHEIIGIYLVTKNIKTPNMLEKYGKSLEAFANLAGSITTGDNQNNILLKLFQLAGIRIFEKEIARQFTEKKLISVGGFTTEIKPIEENGVNIFADLENATGIQEKLISKPDDFAFLINSYFNIIIKTAHKFGFRIDNMMGDGIFIEYYKTFFQHLFKEDYTPEIDEVYALSTYFMVDVFKNLDKITKGTHADDPEKNFLKILQDIQENFNIRMGISTGPSLIMPIGAEERHNFTALGHFVNLAARLESNGMPGQIQTHEDFYLAFANTIIDSSKQKIFKILTEGDDIGSSKYYIENNFLKKNKKATIQKLFIESFRQWDPQVPDLVSIYQSVNTQDIVSTSRQHLQGLGDNMRTIFINWDRKLPVNVFFDTISIFSSETSNEENYNKYIYLLERISFNGLAQKAAARSLENIGIDPVLINKYYELKKEFKLKKTNALQNLVTEENEKSMILLRDFTR